MITASLPDAPHKREGGVWSYISPSRLSLWLKCPLAFKLRYLDGIRTPTSPALFVGRRVHQGLERHYRHRQLGITLDVEQVTGSVTDAWEESAAEEGVEFESLDEEAKLKDQAAGLVRSYLLQLPADEPQPQAVEATMEAALVDPVSGEDLGISMLGVVDLVTETDAGTTIIDFKTSSRSAPPFEVTHEIQLSSYAWLFRQTRRTDRLIEWASLGTCRKDREVQPA